jgi:hypothetical protein
MFRSYDHHQAENVLLTRITQLITDPLFYNIPNIIVVVFYIFFLLFLANLQSTLQIEQ